MRNELIYESMATVPGMEIGVEKVPAGKDVAGQGVSGVEGGATVAVSHEGSSSAPFPSDSRTYIILWTAR